MGNSISATIFNATIVASAIAGVTEIGLLQKIESNGRLSIVDFCKQNHLQEEPFRLLLNSLASFEILSVDSDVVDKSKYFDDVFRNKGYFTWLVKGYVYTLENMDLLLQKENLQVSDVKRNGKFIAKAGKDYGASFVDSYFMDIFAPFTPKCVADIGCGSAERLITIVQNNRSIRGVGIDSNPEAVELAKQNVKRANLEDHINIVLADVSLLKSEKQFDDIDLIYSFFMGHDLFPKENIFPVFNNFKRVFPSADTFLLCDTFRSENLNGGFPIFTLGFEVTHAFMGQIIPTYQEWKELFTELKWKLEEVTNIDIANSVIFNLRMK